MITEKGKSERDAKLLITKLRNFLEHGQEINEEDKQSLIEICNSLLNDEDIYSKSESGRKEEANFQNKIAEHFQVYLLKKAGFKNQKIIDLVPTVGEERNISRMIRRLTNRLEIKKEKGEHWYRLCEGYLDKYYHELIATGRLEAGDYERIESYLERNIERTAYTEGTNMFLMDRKRFAEKLGLSDEEEKDRFMKSMEDARHSTLIRSRTIK